MQRKEYKQNRKIHRIDVGGRRVESKCRTQTLEESIDRMRYRLFERFIYSFIYLFASIIRYYGLFIHYYDFEHIFAFNLHLIWMYLFGILCTARLWFSWLCTNSFFRSSTTIPFQHTHYPYAPQNHNRTQCTKIRDTIRFFFANKRWAATSDWPTSKREIIYIYTFCVDKNYSVLSSCGFCATSQFLVYAIFGFQKKTTKKTKQKYIEVRCEQR